MHAFYSTQVVLPLPSGHRFPMAKYSMLFDKLAADLPGIRIGPAVPASEGELALVHEPRYIQAVADGSLSPQMQKDIGLPWSLQMADRARGSVGATIMATRTALTEGVSANIAGGTHHAYRDKGSGFCVFNDAAVSARLMQVEWLRKYNKNLHVAILDLDVHQGDGTACIFRDDPTIFTVSLHGESNFPFIKQQGDLDIGLPDGCSDTAYLEALEQALEVLESQFDPQLVIYLAGADPHEGDRLGRLGLSFDGLQARDRRVFDWTYQRRIPLAFAMAGGYGKVLEDTVQIQLNTFQVAFEYWSRWQRRVKR